MYRRPTNPGGAGIVNNQVARAFLGQHARTRDSGKKSLVPCSRIKAATADPEDEVALKTVTAGFGSDLAIVEQNRQGHAARIQFAAQFSARRGDGTGSLEDGAHLNGQVCRAPRQRAAERIDARFLIGAKSEQSWICAGV